MNRLVIVDGHAILHRAYHAIPPLTTRNGAPIGAVYGFLSILLRTINDIKPTHLIVAFDRPEPTFRKKLFAQYQSQRPKTEDNLISQIDLMHKILTSMGIGIFELPGFEADDVIGTIANLAINQKRNEEKEVVIVTGDRDILQLVNERIKVLMPVKGLSEAKLFGQKEVLERMEVAPSDIPDLKGLVGDPSDNYPGVSGIGPKTAANLINKYKTIENIYKNIDGIDGKLKQKLITGKENAFLSKQLATIIKDLPVKFDWKASQLVNLDRPDIRALFEEMEFRSLIPRLSDNSKQIIRKKKEGDKKKSVEQTTLF